SDTPLHGTAYHLSIYQRLSHPRAWHRFCHYSKAPTSLGEDAVITLNGLGWQSNVQYQNRIGSEPPVADVLPFRPPVATSNTAQQQNSHGNGSQQNAEDAREEAFAELKVQLQNPDVSARQ